MAEKLVLSDMTHPTNQPMRYLLLLPLFLGALIAACGSGSPASTGSTSTGGSNGTAGGVVIAGAISQTITQSGYCKAGEGAWNYDITSSDATVRFAVDVTTPSGSTVNGKTFPIGLSDSDATVTLNPQDPSNPNAVEHLGWTMTSGTLSVNSAGNGGSMSGSYAPTPTSQNVYNEPLSSGTGTVSGSFTCSGS